MSSFSNSSVTVSTSASVQSTASYPFSTGRVGTVSAVSWSTGVPSPYFQHATSCWSAYNSWHNSWPGYFSSENISTTIASSYTVTYQAASSFSIPVTTIYPTNEVTPFTLCDGVPRAHARPTTVYTTGVQSAYIGTEGLIHGEPTPPCIANHADCEVYWYHSNLPQAGLNTTEGINLAAFCGHPTGGDVPCVIGGGPVQLLYFPVNATDGICTSSNLAEPTTSMNSPVTALGTTFLPGTAYLSFQTLWATYFGGVGGLGPPLPIGPTLTNTILAFPSSEISTNCYNTAPDSPLGTRTESVGYGPGTPLNFADLNLPVGSRVYSCQNRCTSRFQVVHPYPTPDSWSTLTPNPCTTIWDDFRPLIAMPTRIQTLFPEWSTCSFWNYYQENILFDPPSALQQATSAAIATLPSPHTTPAPSPGLSPSSSIAANTAPLMTSFTAIPESGNSSPGDPPPSSSQDPSASLPASQDSAPTTSLALPASDTQPVPASTPDPQPNIEPMPFTQVSSAEISACDSCATIPYTSPSIQSGTSTRIPAHSGTSSALDIPLGQTTISASVVTNGIAVGSITLAVGQEMTTLGDVISAGTAAVVVRPLDPNSDPGSEVLAAGSLTITAQLLQSMTAAIVDGTTLYADGPALTTNGETISMATTGLIAEGEGDGDSEGQSALSATSSVYDGPAATSDQSSSTTETVVGATSDGYCLSPGSLLAFQVLATMMLLL